MKSIRLFVLPIFAILLPTQLFGQSPTHTIKQLGITVEYIQLEQGEANQRVRDHLSRGKSDATALHSALMDLIAAKKARSISSGYLVTRSGQRAKIESIIEHIYPVQFDPPEISQDLSGPIEDGAHIKTHLTATAFNTRNAGLTLEVDPVMGPEGSPVDLNIASEVVEFLGEKPWGQEESRLTQPIFNSIQNSTAITSRDGKWAFLGIHSPSPSLGELNGTSAAKGDEQIIALARIDILRATYEVNKPSKSSGSPLVISTLAEYFEVDAPDAVTLLAKHARTGSSKTLRQELDEFTKTEAARLLDSKSLTTRSGQRAKTESVSEWTYPTKMDSPVVPAKLAGPISKNADIITPAAFTAFETRNIGTTVEIDPVASSDGGRVIDINIAPEIVTLLGDTPRGHGNAQYSSPVFATLKTSAAVSVLSNEPLLISVYMPVNRETHKPDSSKRIFLFLTASALQVE